MIVRRSDFKGGAAWDSGPFAQKILMNSDSGGKRDSEEYDNPSERQDEQTARHQDEGTDFKCFFETVFLIVRKVIFLCVQNKN